MKPLQTGLALSVTVALFYSLCALVQDLWPAQFIAFMNALFHGIDFRTLQVVAPHPWRDYVYALLVITLWAFVVGSFFASFYNVLDRVKAPRSVRYS